MEISNPVQIVILTHGKWGLELVESAELIIGKIEDVKVFSLMPRDSIETYTDRINTFINSMKGRKVLIMTDILGGIPCQIAAIMAASWDNVSAINGLSLEMLLVTEKLRKKYPEKELVSEIIKESNKSILDIKQLFDSIEYS